MKNYFGLLLLSALILLVGCWDDNSDNEIRFVTSPDYPPFEYKEHGELVGFDIELAKLIAGELGKEAVFEEVEFSHVLMLLQNNMADAAISTITKTELREKRFDFSIPYYVESLAIVSHKDRVLETVEDLVNQKIACQLGSTMQIWLKNHAQKTEAVIVNNNLQAIEALKAGYVEGVLIDAVQAKAFISKHPQLVSHLVAQADAGYSLAFKKGSELKPQVDAVILKLQASGKLAMLEQKYLEAQ